MNGYSASEKDNIRLFSEINYYLIQLNQQLFITNVIFTVICLLYFCCMLANDIKQTRSFRSEHHKVLVNIQLTNFWILEQVKSIIENENITYQQYNILCILRNSIIPLSTKELSKRMLDKMSDTSRLIDRLVLKGLAEKKISMIDKRLVDISITQNGMDILEAIDEHNEKIDRIIENLSTEELQLLNRFLDNLHNEKISSNN